MFTVEYQQKSKQYEKKAKIISNPAAHRKTDSLASVLPKCDFLRPILLSGSIFPLSCLKYLMNVILIPQ